MPSSTIQLIQFWGGHKMMGGSLSGWKSVSEEKLKWKMLILRFFSKKKLTVFIVLYCKAGHCLWQAGFQFYQPVWSRLKGIAKPGLWGVQREPHPAVPSRLPVSSLVEVCGSRVRHSPASRPQDILLLGWDWEECTYSIWHAREWASLPVSTIVQWTA